MRNLQKNEFVLGGLKKLSYTLRSDIVAGEQSTGKNHHVLPVLTFGTQSDRNREHHEQNKSRTKKNIKSGVKLLPERYGF